MRRIVFAVLALSIAGCLHASEPTDVAKKLAQDAVIVDTHIDAPELALDEWHDLGSLTPEREFDRMAESGVIGLRFNLNFDSSPSLFAPGAQRTLQIARERGWFAQVHYQGDALLQALPVLRASGLPLVIDHCGRPDPYAGVDQPGFRALLELGREGQAAVKLSSVFRFAPAGFPYAEADPFVHSLIEAFGLERCLWGSDWPFLHAPHRVDHATLLAALRRWIPDPADRRKLFDDNPARLFGFRPAAAPTRGESS